MYINDDLILNDSKANLALDKYMNEDEDEILNTKKETELAAKN
jgi:hypothetical protein